MLPIFTSLNLPAAGVGAGPVVHFNAALRQRLQIQLAQHTQLIVTLTCLAKGFEHDLEATQQRLNINLHLEKRKLDLWERSCRQVINTRYDAQQTQGHAALGQVLQLLRDHPGSTNTALMPAVSAAMQEARALYFGSSSHST
jgi:hypothetical protein